MHYLLIIILELLISLISLTPVFAQEYVRVTILNGVSIELPADWEVCDPDDDNITPKQITLKKALNTLSEDKLNKILAHTRKIGDRDEFIIGQGNKHDEGFISLSIARLEYHAGRHSYDPSNQFDLYEIVGQGLAYWEQTAKNKIIHNLPSDNASKSYKLDQNYCKNSWENMRIERWGKLRGRAYSFLDSCNMQDKLPVYRGNLLIPNTPFSLEIEYCYSASNTESAQSIFKHIFNSIGAPEGQERKMQGVLEKNSGNAILNIPYWGITLVIPDNWQFNFSEQSLKDIFSAGQGEVDSGLLSDLYFRLNGDNGETLAAISMQSYNNIFICDPVGFYFDILTEIQPGKELWMQGFELLEWEEVDDYINVMNIYFKGDTYFIAVDQQGRMFYNEIFTFVSFTNPFNNTLFDENKLIVTITYRQDKERELKPVIQAIVNSITEIKQ